MGSDRGHDRPARYINRLIIQLDFIISVSQRVLMVPEDVVPDNMQPSEFAKEVGGNPMEVIFYKGPRPHQKSTQNRIAKLY